MELCKDLKIALSLNLLIIKNDKLLFNIFLEKSDFLDRITRLDKEDVDLPVQEIILYNKHFITFSLKRCPFCNRDMDISSNGKYFTPSLDRDLFDPFDLIEEKIINKKFCCSSLKTISQLGFLTFNEDNRLIINRFTLPLKVVNTLTEREYEMNDLAIAIALNHCPFCNSSLINKNIKDLSYYI